MVIRMKRFLLVLLILIIGVSCVIFSSCENKDKGNSEVSIIKVEALEDTVPDSVSVNEIDVTKIKLRITYSDQTTKDVYLSEDMLTAESRAMLSVEGTHVLTAVYEGKAVKFFVKLKKAEEVKYKLSIYGGLPVSVNGKNLTGVTVNAGDHYEGSFSVGDEVVIAWTDDGFIFSHWTANDAKVGTESRIGVIMNADYVYRAFSTSQPSTVSFETFCDQNIDSITVDKVYGNEIKTIFRDDYVFVGWTTDQISLDQSLNNYARNPVTFPFEVTRDIVFYAVWKPLGIKYVECDGGYAVSGYDGYATELIIPDVYNSKNVKKIEKNAFNGDNIRDLSKITIGNNIEEIEEGAFADLIRLKEFTVKEGNVAYLTVDGVLYDANKKTLVAYPAFKPLTSYAVDENVETVSAFAFKDAMLGAVILDSRLVELRRGCFDSAHLDYIDFSNVSPVSLNITAKIFNDNLSKIYLRQELKNSFVGLLPIIADVKNKIITDSEKLTRFFTYTRVETDGYHSTTLCRIIENPNFDEKGEVAEIIAGDRNLKVTTIPNKITVDNELGEQITYKIVSVGDYCYKNCAYLSDVVLPYSTNIERIGSGAFDDTVWLQSKSEKYIAVNGVFYKYFGKQKEFALPTGVSKIAEGAFSGNEYLVHLNIGENTTLRHVCAYAFYNCFNFKGFICEANADGDGVYIKGEVRDIGAFAFYNTAITRIRLQEVTNISQNNLSSIGEYAFAECRYLNYVELGEATSVIANNAFLSSYCIEKFSIKASNPFFEVFDGILYKKSGNEYALFNYPAGRMDGVFNPVEAASYKENVTIRELDESIPVQESSVCVGSIRYNGGSYDVYVRADANGEKQYYFEFESRIRELYGNPASGMYFYNDVKVTAIEEYALYHSNIAALFIPSAIKRISDDSIYIPGLNYVRFEGIPAINFTPFMNSGVDFVVIEEQYIADFFPSDQAIINKYFRSADSDLPRYFYGKSEGEDEIDKGILYSYENETLKVARTSRTQREFVIPESVYDEESDTAFIKAITIGKFAFYGANLLKCTLKGVVSIDSDAFSAACNFNELVIDCDFISDVQTDSFGDKINNGLFVIDVRNSINLYENKKEWGFKFDSYIGEDGRTVIYSDYLITKAEGAFAVIGYNIGKEDERILGVYYGELTPEQIDAISEQVNVTGYEIDKFIDKYGKIIENDVTYKITTNTVLECVLTPKEYRIVLEVSSNVTVNGLQEIYKDENTGVRRYEKIVKYDELYNIEATSEYGKVLWRTADGSIVDLECNGKWSSDVVGDIVLYAYVQKVESTAQNTNTASASADCYLIVYELKNNGNECLPFEVRK